MTSPRPNLDDLRIEREPERESNGFLPWLIVLVALLLGGAAAFWWFGRAKPLVVRTAVARDAASGGPGGERTVLNASGYVTARREATVSSKVTGKVSEVLIEEGVRVREGQVLARLDDTNVRASLLLAEAQAQAAKSALEEVRVRLKEAEQEWRRQSALVKTSAVTQAEFDRTEATMLATRARLTQLESAVVVAERTAAVMQQQVDDTIIRAPFAGVVTSKNAQPGEMISPMSSGGFTRTGICTIVDMESLEVEIDVNESYINRVEAGQPVQAVLDAYPEWKIPCKVIAIIPTADRQKSTVRVRVGFDKLDPRILPQMAVKVAFHETGPPSAAASRGAIVPKAALRNQGGRDVVFVLQGGRVERRAVTVTRTESDQAVIGAGVSAGEKIILDAPAGLTDGATVEEAKR